MFYMLFIYNDSVVVDLLLIKLVVLYEHNNNNVLVHENDLIINLWKFLFLYVL